MRRLKSKPVVVGALAGALVLTFAAWRFASPSAAEAPRLERYLPAETVGFVEVNNLRTQAIKIMDSEAWRAFADQNQAASTFFMMAANHAGVLDASYAVALIGISSNAEGAPAPQFVLVGEFTSAGERRTFERRVLRLTRRSSEGEEEVKPEQYGDATIRVVKSDKGRGFIYAQAGNLLFLSNTPEAVRKVLDVRGGKAASLEGSEAFVRARSGKGEGEAAFGYLDAAALTRLVDSAPAGEKGKIESFRQLFHGVGADSVRTVTMKSSFVDGRVVERFDVVAPESTGILRTVASNPPTTGALLALVPSNALHAFDASIANVPQAFDQLASLLDGVGSHEGRKGFVEGLAEFKAKTGMDLRQDLLGQLGGEVCVAQVGTNEGKGGLLIVAVKDAQGFSATVEKLAKSKGQEVTWGDYEGVRIAQTTGGKGDGFHFAFVNGNFVGSGNRRALESAIEAARSGDSLASSQSYRSASSALRESPQFIYYGSNADYLNGLGRTLSGGEQEFKTSGQSVSLRPSFAFGVARPDGFHVESHTPLGTFPRLLASITARLGDEKKREKKAE